MACRSRGHLLDPQPPCRVGISVSCLDYNGTNISSQYPYGLRAPLIVKSSTEPTYYNYDPTKDFTIGVSEWVRQSFIFQSCGSDEKKLCFVFSTVIATEQ